MNEQTARKILKDAIDGNNLNNKASGWDDPFIIWHTENKTVILDGDFTAEQLEAIVWWMKSHTPSKTIIDGIEYILTHKAGTSTTIEFTDKQGKPHKIVIDHSDPLNMIFDVDGVKELGKDILWKLIQKK